MHRPTEIYEDEALGRDRCVERKRETDRQTDRHAYRPTEIYEDEVIGRDRCVERKR